MSGPKVVNIEAVRRRQKREGLAQLRKLQLALAECARWQVQPQASAVLSRLNALHQAEQWEPLLLESGPLSSFYEEEAHRLRQQHAAEQAASLRKAHRFEQSIAQMTGQLQSQPASAERDALIHQLTSDDSSIQQSAVNEALHFIGQTQRGQSTNRLSELAASLMDSELASSAPAIPLTPADPHQQRLEKCWSLLGELSALADSPDIQALSTKARSISASPADQQPLLLDSLALELSAHLQNRRVIHALLHEMELFLIELEEIRSPAAAEWKQRLTKTLTQPLLDLKSARQLAEDARAWIEQTFAEETQLEQRGAVLRALAATGYEVREGMAAAWVEQGRLVVRKPNESAYGIEISAPPQGNAVQTRVVALGNSVRDPQRDLEVEETWCGEFEKARAVLDDAGFKASLIQTKPAGSIPLKTVENFSSNQQQEVLMQRRLQK
jgi:hypothetical protein